MTLTLTVCVMPLKISRPRATFIDAIAAAALPAKCGARNDRIAGWHNVDALLIVRIEAGRKRDCKTLANEATKSRSESKSGTKNAYSRATSMSFVAACLARALANLRASELSRRESWQKTAKKKHLLLAAGVSLRLVPPALT